MRGRAKSGFRGGRGWAPVASEGRVDGGGCGGPSFYDVAVADVEDGDPAGAFAVDLVTGLGQPGGIAGQLLAAFVFAAAVRVVGVRGAPAGRVPGGSSRG